VDHANSQTPEEQRRKEQREDEEAEQKSAAGAHIVYKAVLKEGEDELERSVSALAWSGLAAGLSMGFSMVCEGLLRSRLPDAHWRPLIAKIGYSMGFLIVVLGRQQLFTENTLTAVLPLLQHRDSSTLLKVMRLWGVVLVSNLVGAVLFAWVAGRTQTFTPETRAAFLAIGHEALAHGPGVVLLRGIFAGWLIALMVWLLPVAEVARIWVIIFVTYVVGLADLAHIIAGSVETSYVVIMGEATWGRCIAGYTLPALTGNILGGVALVAALNHAQVVSGRDEKSLSRQKGS
jgi:formate/nitrite transporter FocA (FNT family)